MAWRPKSSHGVSRHPPALSTRLSTMLAASSKPTWARTWRRATCGRKAAIADPTRRRLLDLILASGETTATAFARDLPITRQGIAKHLAASSERVSSKPPAADARSDSPSAKTASTRPRAGVAQILARWDERLATIKRLAETEGALRTDPAGLSGRETEAVGDGGRLAAGRRARLVEDVGYVNRHGAVAARASSVA